MQLEDMEFPDDAYYEKFGSYLMVKIEEGKARVYITDFGLKVLADVVYIELPSVGDEVKQGEPFGSLETVKATGELYSPLSGEVVEVNDEALSDPNVLKEKGKNWLIAIKPSNLEEELKNLMDVKKAIEYYKEELEKARKEGILK